MQDFIRAIETVAIFNEISRKALSGIVNFEDYADDVEKFAGCVVYDEATGKVVCDTCLIGGHRDIVGFYDNVGVPLRVIEDDGEKFVTCDFPGGVSFVIDDGRWYASSL